LRNERTHQHRAGGCHLFRSCVHKDANDLHGSERGNRKGCISRIDIPWRWSVKYQSDQVDTGDGVFVNAAPEEVAAKCMDYRLDYIQLHGIETPQYLISLREQLPEKVKIIKAFSIQNAEDLKRASGYEGLCDYFLFDTKTSGYGGSGEAFDWNILQQYKGFTEFLLSGGIAPDSLEALSRFQHKLCAGVDLNSRFETAPGIKDIPLLKEFVQQLKQNKR